MGKFAENLNLGKRVLPPWFSGCALRLKCVCCMLKSRGKTQPILEEHDPARACAFTAIQLGYGKIATKQTQTLSFLLLHVIRQALWFFSHDFNLLISTNIIFLKQWVAIKVRLLLENPRPSSLPSSMSRQNLKADNVAVSWRCSESISDQQCHR